MKIKLGREMKRERERDRDIDDSVFVVVSKSFVAALRSNAELCSRGTPHKEDCLLLLHYLNVH